MAQTVQPNQQPEPFHALVPPYMPEMIVRDLACVIPIRAAGVAPIRRTGDEPGAGSKRL